MDKKHQMAHWTPWQHSSPWAAPSATLPLAQAHRFHTRHAHLVNPNLDGSYLSFL